jgi:hypothetical protein
VALKLLRIPSRNVFIIAASSILRLMPGELPCQPDSIRFVKSKIRNRDEELEFYQQRIRTGGTVFAFGRMFNRLLKSKPTL